MPLSPSIRKQILRTLEERIIPTLQSQDVVQILAEPPYDFGEAAHQIKRRKLLAHKPHSSIKLFQEWKKEGMVSSAMLCLGFIYEGVRYERIGMTAPMLAHRATPRLHSAGITQVQMAAPSVICHPPFSIRGDGQFPQEMWDGITRTLVVQLTEQDVRVADQEHYAQRMKATHHLLIEDPLLARLGYIYLDELRQKNNRQSSQAQLLAFMYRLQRHIETARPGFSNSCWPDLTPIIARIEACHNPTHQAVCNEAVHYIQRHLQAHLHLALIARQCDLSGNHLNTIFRSVLGTTVMNYVTQQRIEIAREMLTRTPETISDIAQLAGFSGTASFCNVFRRHTGLTPGQYRQKQRNPSKSA